MKSHCHYANDWYLLFRRKLKCCQERFGTSSLHANIKNIIFFITVCRVIKIEVRLMHYYWSLNEGLCHIHTNINVMGTMLWVIPRLIIPGYFLIFDYLLFEFKMRNMKSIYGNINVYALVKLVWPWRRERWLTCMIMRAYDFNACLKKNHVFVIFHHNYRIFQKHLTPNIYSLWYVRSISR